MNYAAYWRESDTLPGADDKAGIAEIMRAASGKNILFYSFIFSGSPSAAASDSQGKPPVLPLQLLLSFPRRVPVL